MCVCTHVCEGVCVCVYVHACVCEGVCVCTLYICTSLSSPYTWLREQVCHIVHVIFGVGIQIHLWKSMVGEQLVTMGNTGHLL